MIKGFHIAEIANFDEKQQAEYEESLKVYSIFFAWSFISMSEE